MELLKRVGWVLVMAALSAGAQKPAVSGPGFEAATIKPSAPGQRGRSLGWDGRRFTAHDTTMSQMLQFAYNVQAKQIVGEPSWFDTETFDIDGVAEAGEPSAAEWRERMQRLLEDRLGMKYHREPRVMSAYALTVAKGGAKLQPAKDVEGMTKGVRIQRGPHLWMRVVGVYGTMPQLAAELQRVETDRPVVDQTGLKGEFNFDMTATSTKPFFAGETPATDGSAPPELFTAIREELGLKLEPVKTDVECIVLDQIQKPSAN